MKVNPSIILKFLSLDILIKQKVCNFHNIILMVSLRQNLVVEMLILWGTEKILVICRGSFAFIVGKNGGN